MKNRPNAEDAQQHKTRRVILIQDKRAEVSAPPAGTAQVQSTHVRCAFGQNRIKGNEQSLAQEPATKPIAEQFTQEPETPRELTSSQLDFVISSLLVMKAEVMKLSSQMETFQARIDRLEANQEQEPEAPRKKKRRKAQQIVKSFICTQQSCRKAYGSEVSLNLHIRLKHIEQQGVTPGSNASLESGSKQPLTPKPRRAASQQSMEGSMQNHPSDSSN